MRSFREYPSEEGLLINRPLSWDERYFLSSISMNSLIDDIRVLKSLDAAGIRTAFDAACVKRLAFLAVRGVGIRSWSTVSAVIEGVLEDFLELDCVIEWRQDGVRRMVEEKMFCWLTDREIKILKDRYGLWDGKALTIREIASELGVTRSRVSQIQQKAEMKLRQRIASRVLAVRLLEGYSYMDQIEKGGNEIVGGLLCKMLKIIVGKEDFSTWRLFVSSS